MKSNLISGSSAALAAIFSTSLFLTIAKIGFDFSDTALLSHLEGAPFYAAHGFFILLMLLSNSIMLSFYIKSLQEHGAAKATVLNFAVNFIATVIFRLKSGLVHLELGHPRRGNKLEQDWRSITHHCRVELNCN